MIPFQIFRKSYEFVDSIKSKERDHLKNELKSEQDPERIKQIKYLIQRMVSSFFFSLLQKKL